MKNFLPISIVAATIAILTYFIYLSNTPVEKEITSLPNQKTLPINGRILTVGSIAVEDIQDEVNDFLPITKVLARKLKEVGIVDGQVKVARSMSEMATFLEQGKVDIYIDSPFPTLTMVRQGVAKPMLRRWKKGVASYYSIIFTYKDSNIVTLDDLKGKNIAFDVPSSTSGHLLPKAILLEAGYPLKELNDKTQKSKNDKIGYVFSQDDVNTMTWVLERKISAGAIDNHNFYKEAGERIGELKILARSPEVPRHLVVQSAGLEENIASAIKEALILLDQDEAGRVALFEFQKTTKFDEIPLESLQRVIKLMELVEGEL